MMSSEAKSSFYQETMWTRYVIVFLGIWLIAVAWNFNYSSSPLWWSDFLAGIALIVSGISVLAGYYDFTPWDTGIIALWLLAAPILLLSPEPFMYLNDTAIGLLTFAFSALIPSVPEDTLREGEKTPPGWSYNPSSWMQRLPIIALAIVGWIFALYIATHQLGWHEQNRIEESFSNVTQSSTMKGLEAQLFLLIGVLACLGSSRRWHTMPWIVTLFSMVTIPFGLILAIYALFQPLMTDYFCSSCFLVAVCFLGIVALSIDEIIAVATYFADLKQSGKPLMHIFWQGDGGSNQKTSELPTTYQESFALVEMFRGVRVTWPQLFGTLIAFIILLSTRLFTINETTADNLYLVGSLILVVYLLTFAEILSALRYLNILLAIILIGNTWRTFSQSPPIALFYVLCGIAIVILSIWKGKSRESYGTANKLMW